MPVIVDLKYYFNTIEIVNTQPEERRHAFFCGVYRTRSEAAPDARTKALLEKYQQKHDRPPLRNSLG